MPSAWSGCCGAVLLGLTGCINGPVRYAALGDAKFATVEFSKEAEAPLVPFAAVGGLVTDVALVAPDTVSFVIVTVFVGPYETVKSTFQPDVPAWRYVVLPVAIPVGSVAYGIYTAVKPYNLTPALGWSEGGKRSKAPVKPRPVDDAPRVLPEADPSGGAVR